jgi:hypothetical protein
MSNNNGSVATLERPSKRHNGVAITSVPSVDSLVARMPEIPDVPNSDANMTEAAAAAIAGKLLADTIVAAKEAQTKAVKLASTILDGTKLSIYINVGDACYNAIRLAKAEIDISCANRQAESTWNSDYWDSWCATYSHQVRVLYPGLVRPLQEESEIAAAKARKKADSTVRVGEWIHSALTVGAIAPLVPASDVMTLSYNIVKEYLNRTVKYSKSALTSEVKAEWVDFLKTELPRLIGHKIEAGSFIAAFKKKEEEITLASKLKKNENKTAEQIAAAELKKENDKKAREHAKLRTDTATALATNLTAAIGGVLSDQEVKTIVETVESQAGRKVVTGEPTVYAFDPAQFSADQFKTGIKALMIADRHDEVKAILAHARKLESLLTIESAPTLPFAAAV